MRHHPQLDIIAIGGEDGIIRLYDVIEISHPMEPCLQYSKSFERQESRILSLFWHPRGKVRFLFSAFSMVNLATVFDRH